MNGISGFDLPPISWTADQAAWCSACSGVLYREGGMKPLTIVVSFDVGEQVVPSSIQSGVARLMHELGFHATEAAFHWCLRAPPEIG